MRHHGQMSDQQDAEPGSGPGSSHRTRPRRRAARPAGPPAPSTATALIADHPVTPATPASVDAPSTLGSRSVRTRTKARHSAKSASTPAPREDARAAAPAQAPATTQSTRPTKAPAKTPAKTQSTAPAKAPGRRGRPGFTSRDDSSDAGWRDLIGAGPSKVGLSGALRARDVDRPTAEDLAQAQRSVVIVRRDPDDPRPSNAAASGDAPPRRPRRKRPSGSGV